MRALLWAFYVSVCVALVRCQDVEESGPKRLADDENLDISNSMGDIVSKGTMELKEDEENLLPDSHNLVHDLEQRAVELKKLHPMVKQDHRNRQEEQDVEHEHTLFLCQRDYKQPCPLSFRHVAEKDGETRCIPPPSYTGPCIGQELVYRDMPEEEKIAWARDCLANWPCVKCRRRYSNICPEKWELVKDPTAKGSTCQATEEYDGPCRGEKHSFERFNIEMQKKWSRRCQAWWPCDANNSPTIGPDVDLPITLAATFHRIDI